MMTGTSEMEAELREWRKKAPDGALHHLIWHEVTDCLRSEDLDLICNAWAAVREFEAAIAAMMRNSRLFPRRIQYDSQK